MVIKSLTVTAPVKDADAPLVMVKFLMATEVPVIAPVAEFKFKSKALVIEFTKRMLPVPVLRVVSAPKVIASL